MKVHMRRIKNSTMTTENLNLTVCEISDELKLILKEFRFRKSNKCDAVVMKVDKEKREIVLEHEMVDTTIEELTEELPDHQPRFVLLSYELENLAEGRKSYPLCFIFLSPRDCNPEMQMMYAGSKLSLQNHINSGKVFELRELEDFTEEWLREKLM